MIRLEQAVLVMWLEEQGKLEMMKFESRNKEKQCSLACILLYTDTLEYKSTIKQ